MTRQEAYEAVDKERISQDKVWRTGRWTEEQYTFAAPHILLLEEGVAKLRSIWYGSMKEDNIQDRLVKIAAVAIRALEEIHNDKV